MEISKAMQRKLANLRRDYTAVAGYPFAYFFCPILFKDEQVELCKAHIINEAFPGSDRSWTVQRKDVDNFYGTHFESDFAALRYKLDGLSPPDAVVDKVLAGKLNPRIFLNNNPVDFFPARGPVHEEFTRVELETKEAIFPLAIKMHPVDFASEVEQDWTIEIRMDVRLPALVSIIKSAYLTLFEMCGYSYVLSRAGSFVGHHILGRFFHENRHLPKSEILQNAGLFFLPFVNMVRPVLSTSDYFQGTITDRQLLVCQTNNIRWAWVVYVRTSQQLNAAILPIWDSTAAISMYLDFLVHNGDFPLETSLYQFKGSHWITDAQTRKMIWPRANFRVEDVDC